ncbi:MAG: DUF1848 family protein [Armatimonadetes bacterium]|nr:DUF1848 family protein [Armatimonadota bacterium]
MNHPGVDPWSSHNLRPGALGVSASRRTDIPALFARWFARRLEEGYAEYIPAGPPRRLRCSLRPQDVTHFTFWTKWPRPFFRTLERVLELGYPVLWNLTVTGLGGSSVEPHVPAWPRAVDAARELAAMVGPAAVLWRYDPIFLSERFDERHHRETFRRLAEALAGHVDRVAVSFVTPYGRRVAPDLKRWEKESGDSLPVACLDRQAELAAELRAVAREMGLELTVCCSVELRERLGCARSGCNAFAWACRVYPGLQQHAGLKDRPTRADCGCSQEVDIGVYDTCILGCRYSYGSCDLARARRKFARHDWRSACLT